MTFQIVEMHFFKQNKNINQLVLLWLPVALQWFDDALVKLYTQGRLIRFHKSFTNKHQTIWRLKVKIIKIVG